jgi:hypothetical protein
MEKKAKKRTYNSGLWDFLIVLTDNVFKPFSLLAIFAISALFCGNEARSYALEALTIFEDHKLIIATVAALIVIGILLYKIKILQDEIERVAGERDSIQKEHGGTLKSSETE